MSWVAGIVKVANIVGAVSSLINVGKQIYEIIDDREREKEEYTNEIIKSGDIFMSYLMNTLNNKITILLIDRQLYYNSKIIINVNELNKALLTVRPKIKNLKISNPSSKFLTSNIALLDDSFVAFEEVIINKETELKKQIIDEYHATVKNYKSEYTGVIESWRNTTNTRTLTFAGDKYVSSTCKQCYNNLNNMFAHRFAANFKQKLLDDIDIAFKRIISTSRDEHKSLNKLLINMVKEARWGD
jgi:hypothetical protein